MYFHGNPVTVDGCYGQNLAAGAGGLGGVFEKIRQDSLDLVRIRPGGRKPSPGLVS